MALFYLFMTWLARNRKSKQDQPPPDPETGPLPVVGAAHFFAAKRAGIERRTGVTTLTEEEMEDAIAAEMNNVSHFGGELARLVTMRSVARERGLSMRRHDERLI